MARVLDVSGRGFYAWLERPRSPPVVEDERLKVALRAAPVKPRDTYGAKRWPPEWQAEGFTVGRDRIARLRRQLGRGGKQKRNFQPTPPPHHAWPVADTLLGQGVEATAPNEVWHTAITSLSSGEGGLSLAGVKDQFTCPIVGYARGTRLPPERVGQALADFLPFRKPEISYNLLIVLNKLMSRNRKGSAYILAGFH